MTELTAERLADMIAHLRTPRPTPVAIWLVDRPAVYYQLLKASASDETQYNFLEFTFYGLPVHNITVDPHPAVKYYVTPFHRKPGVWIEMSDGKHLRLGDLT